MADVDYCVIGAGFAGLVAALRLKCSATHRPGAHRVRSRVAPAVWPYPLGRNRKFRRHARMGRRRHPFGGAWGRRGDGREGVARSGQPTRKLLP